MEEAAWLVLAHRCGWPDAEKWRVALEDGPDPADFPDDLVAKEAEDVAALRELGVRLLTPQDDHYPERLRRDGGPLALQVAGRALLMDTPGVEFFGRVRGEEGARLMDRVEGGGRAVVVLSKGMLKARTLLGALREPIDYGTVALVSAEPPRASWGPVRDARRDALLALLRV